MRRVIIVEVVWRELKIPLELSSVGIKRKDRVAVEIVADAVATVVAGRGIARRPVKKIQLRIIAAGDPGRSTTCLPRVAGPGFMAGFAGAGNGVEAPATTSGVGVVRLDETTDTVVATRDANDDFIFERQARL